MEFALVIPIFLLLVLGLFDLGRAVYYHSTISNASREAVRLWIVDQNAGEIRQAASDSASAVLRVPTGDVTVEFLAPDLTSGGQCTSAPDLGCVVRVKVTHAFAPATPFVGALNLQAETHQPIERRYVSP